MASEARRLPERLVRGLVALLAMPVLLLVALAVALWVIAPHKNFLTLLKPRVVAVGGGSPSI